MPPPLLIKIGGAAITNKSAVETIDHDRFQALIRFVAAQHHRSTSIRWPSNVSGSPFPQPSSLLLVHGAGSFGHHIAKEHGLKGTNSYAVVAEEQPRQLDTALRLGMAATRTSVRKLNGLIVEELVRHGVPAIGITPGLLVKSSRGQIHELKRLYAAVHETLRQGMVPVLHGDVVADDAYGAVVWSGDDIVKELALFDPDQIPPRCCFVTDVEGVFERYPLADGEIPCVVSRIRVDRSSGEIVEPAALAVGNGSEAVAGPRADVTGGMRNKMQAAIDMVRGGVQCVQIVGHPTIVNDAGAAWESLRGTRIEAAI
ncbi:Aspartate/glutamate/uridylate kinase [Polychytrium aggregatum]|uniref:Aspartate/glutamate/uridylate kinase n=1 Tax=Polychytrium aggregatum TaxID=110093 RepID=UPI0022FEE951|nr:Aspartate/glutamate/uridylate kinase [Polychytrium aggregatum]KAI9209717.1 Aspartate/glutamate/uridylate kinase [Polychytrium aggregatum]